MHPGADQIRSIYAGIESVTGLRVDLQGWNVFHELMAELVHRTQPKVIVEVGVWKGASLLAMAGLCRKEGLGTILYGVDTWHGLQGAMIGWLPETAVPVHWDRPSFYQQFLFNVKRSGYDDCVVPVCAFSDWGARMLGNWQVVSDLLYVDASHDELHAYADMHAYWELLRSGGVMFGDDLTDSYPGVERAVVNFCAAKGIPWERRGGHWVIAKP